MKVANFIYCFGAEHCQDKVINAYAGGLKQN